ncbi:MAG: hypothetical protein QXF25_00650 [Candidatus Pacearchaeota archaeon]
MYNFDFERSLKNAEKYFLNAEHLLNVTFKLVNEKRILLNVVENLYKSLLYSVDSILKLEYELRRVRLYQDSKKNFQLFKDIACSYGITNEQLKTIDEIFLIIKKYKESSMEFVRGEKVVFMPNGSQPVYIDLIKVKNYIEIGKSILERIKEKARKYGANV